MKELRNRHSAPLLWKLKSEEDGEKPTEKEIEKFPQTQTKNDLVEIYPNVNQVENVLIFGRCLWQLWT